MDIINKKREIFANLSAIKALGNLPEINISDSFSSITNKINSTDFLIDLVMSLVGIKPLKDYVIDIMAFKLPQIEKDIKDALKTELKKTVSCGINPTIPTWFQNGGVGIELKVTDVDFFDVMKVNPESAEGGLLYTDILLGNLKDSKDFNTYLYSTIQAGTGVAQEWGDSVNGIPVLESEFIPTGTINNVIKYKASSAYTGKKLAQFNNDYIDSISLFGNPDSLSSSKLMSSILEELFGSISSAVGIKKSKKQIQKELEFKECLTCILEAETDTINDSLFTFDNPTLAKIDRESNDRRKGIREIKTCGNLKVSVSSGVASQVIANIDATKDGPKSEEVDAIINALDSVAETQAGFLSNDVNKQNVKNNFFKEIIKNLQNVVITAMMSPEFILLFAINHKIVTCKTDGTIDTADSYDGPIDFIKKNRKIVKSIGKIISNVIIGLLLNIALQYITKLLKRKLIDDKIEKEKNYVSVLLSHLGVPPDVIAKIRKISSQPIPNFK